MGVDDKININVEVTIVRININNIIYNWENWTHSKGFKDLCAPYTKLY